MLVKDKDKYDLYVGLFFVITGIFLFINITSMNAPTYDVLGSKFIPQFICSSFAILGSSLVLKSINIKKKTNDGVAVSNADEAYVETSESGLKSSLFFLISTVCYFLALEFNLGFIFSTSVYLVIEMMIIDHGLKKYKIIHFVVVAVAVSVAIYFVFEKFLMLMLP